MQRGGILSSTVPEVTLKPGEVSEFLFWLLIELSSLRSEKAIRALSDFLILGYTRREVCEKYHLSGSHFSVALRQLMRVNDLARLTASYYNATTA